MYDALGNHDAYTFDGGNNLTQKQDRRGFAWNNTYDGRGNVLTAADPYTNTTTTTYNAHNRRLTVKTQTGRSVANTYDASDNLTQTQEKDAGGNVRATTGFTYDWGYGLLYSKTDANNHRTLYGYDANGYLNGSVTPAGRQYLWNYDSLGFQTSRTDPMNRTVSYTADAWERLVTTTYPDSTTATFAYDPNGNLTNFNNYTANWSRTYDADDRETAEYCGAAQAIRYAYDAPGQKGLKSSFTDSSGRTVSYAYTARNELSAVAEAAGTTTYLYNPNGQPSQTSLPNGVRTDWFYLDNGWHGSHYNLVNATGAVLSAYDDYFNGDGQITGSSEGTSTDPGSNNAAVTNYAYDGQGHLSSEARTGNTPYTRSFTCDGAGNRVSQGGNNLNGPFTYDADDALTGFSNPQGGATFGYDADGQRTSETTGFTAGFAGYTSQFGYDFDGQLTSITKAGNTTTFRYDPLGRQVSRAVNGAVTGYGFDGGQLILEGQGSAITATYTWGIGLIRRNGEYPLADGRGTARQTSNGGGAVTSTTVTEGFGQTVGGSGSTASPYGYNASSGYRSDGDGATYSAPLMKVGARYYDPEFGVFLTRDTELDQKPYAYCDGDPINCTDPSGHQKKKETKKPQTSAEAKEFMNFIKEVIEMFLGGLSVSGTMTYHGASSTHMPNGTVINSGATWSFSFKITKGKER